MSRSNRGKGKSSVKDTSLMAERFYLNFLTAFEAYATAIVASPFETPVFLSKDNNIPFKALLSSKEVIDPANEALLCLSRLNTMAGFDVKDITPKLLPDLANIALTTVYRDVMRHPTRLRGVAYHFLDISPEAMTGVTAECASRALCGVKGHGAVGGHDDNADTDDVMDVGGRSCGRSDTLVIAGASETSVLPTLSSSFCSLSYSSDHPSPAALSSTRPCPTTFTAPIMPTSLLSLVSILLIISDRIDTRTAYMLTRLLIFADYIDRHAYTLMLVYEREDTRSNVSLPGVRVSATRGEGMEPNIDTRPDNGHVPVRASISLDEATAGVGAGLPLGNGAKGNDRGTIGTKGSSMSGVTKPVKSKTGPQKNPSSAEIVADVPESEAFRKIRQELRNFATYLPAFMHEYSQVKTALFNFRKKEIQERIRRENASSRSISRSQRKSARRQEKAESLASPVSRNFIEDFPEDFSEKSGTSNAVPTQLVPTVTRADVADAAEGDDPSTADVDDIDVDAGEHHEDKGISIDARQIARNLFPKDFEIPDKQVPTEAFSLLTPSFPSPASSSCIPRPVVSSPSLAVLTNGIPTLRDSHAMYCQSSMPHELNGLPLSILSTQQGREPSSSTPVQSAPHQSLYWYATANMSCLSNVTMAASLPHITPFAGCALSYVAVKNCHHCRRGYDDNHDDNCDGNCDKDHVDSYAMDSMYDIDMEEFGKYFFGKYNIPTPEQEESEKPDISHNTSQTLNIPAKPTASDMQLHITSPITYGFFQTGKNIIFPELQFFRTSYSFESWLRVFVQDRSIPLLIRGLMAAEYNVANNVMVNGVYACEQYLFHHFQDVYTHTKSSPVMERRPSIVGANVAHHHASPDAFASSSALPLTPSPLSCVSATSASTPPSLHLYSPTSCLCWSCRDWYHDYVIWRHRYHHSYTVAIQKSSPYSSTLSASSLQLSPLHRLMSPSPLLSQFISSWIYSPKHPPVTPSTISNCPSTREKSTSSLNSNTSSSISNDTNIHPFLSQTPSLLSLSLAPLSLASNLTTNATVQSTTGTVPISLGSFPLPPPIIPIESKLTPAPNLSHAPTRNASSSSFSPISLTRHLPWPLSHLPLLPAAHLLSALSSLYNAKEDKVSSYNANRGGINLDSVAPRTASLDNANEERTSVCLIKEQNRVDAVLRKDTVRKNTCNQEYFLACDPLPTCPSSTVSSLARSASSVSCTSSFTSASVTLPALLASTPLLSLLHLHLYIPLTHTLLLPILYYTKQYLSKKTFPSATSKDTKGLGPDAFTVLRAAAAVDAQVPMFASRAMHTALKTCDPDRNDANGRICLNNATASGGTAACVTIAQRYDVQNDHPTDDTTTVDVDVACPDGVINAVSDVASNTTEAANRHDDDGGQNSDVRSLLPQWLHSAPSHPCSSWSTSASSSALASSSRLALTADDTPTCTSASNTPMPTSAPAASSPTPTPTTLTPAPITPSTTTVIPLTATQTAATPTTTVTPTTPIPSKPLPSSSEVWRKVGEMKNVLNITEILSSYTNWVKSLDIVLPYLGKGNIFGNFISPLVSGISNPETASSIKIPISLPSTLNYLYTSSSSSSSSSSPAPASTTPATSSTTLTSTSTSTAAAAAAADVSRPFTILLSLRYFLLTHGLAHQTALTLAVVHAWTAAGMPTISEINRAFMDNVQKTTSGDKISDVYDVGGVPRALDDGASGALKVLHEMNDGAEKPLEVISHPVVEATDVVSFVTTLASMIHTCAHTQTHAETATSDLTRKPHAPNPQFGVDFGSPRSDSNSLNLDSRVMSTAECYSLHSNTLFTSPLAFSSDSAFSPTFASISTAAASGPPRCLSPSQLTALLSCRDHLAVITDKLSPILTIIQEEIKTQTMLLGKKKVNKSRLSERNVGMSPFVGVSTNMANNRVVDRDVDANAKLISATSNTETTNNTSNSNSASILSTPLKPIPEMSKVQETPNSRNFIPEEMSPSPIATQPLLIQLLLRPSIGTIRYRISSGFGLSGISTFGHGSPEVRFYLLNHLLYKDTVESLQMAVYALLLYGEGWMTREKSISKAGCVSKRKETKARDNSEGGAPARGSRRVSGIAADGYSGPTAGSDDGDSDNVGCGSLLSLTLHRLMVATAREQAHTRSHSTANAPTSVSTASADPPVDSNEVSSVPSAAHTIPTAHAISTPIASSVASVERMDPALENTIAASACVDDVNAGQTCRDSDLSTGLDTVTLTTAALSLAIPRARTPLISPTVHDALFTTPSVSTSSCTPTPSATSTSTSTSTFDFSPSPSPGVCAAPCSSTPGTPSALVNPSLAFAHKLPAIPENPQNSANSQIAQITPSILAGLLSLARIECGDDMLSSLLRAHARGGTYIQTHAHRHPVAATSTLMHTHINAVDDDAHKEVNTSALYSTSSSFLPCPFPSSSSHTPIIFPSLPLLAPALTRIHRTLTKATKTINSLVREKCIDSELGKGIAEGITPIEEGMDGVDRMCEDRESLRIRNTNIYHLIPDTLYNPENVYVPNFGKISFQAIDSPSTGNIQENGNFLRLSEIPLSWLAMYIAVYACKYSDILGNNTYSSFTTGNDIIEDDANRDCIDECNDNTTTSSATDTVVNCANIPDILFTDTTKHGSVLLSATRASTTLAPDTPMRDGRELLTATPSTGVPVIDIVNQVLIDAINVYNPVDNVNQHDDNSDDMLTLRIPSTSLSLLRNAIAVHKTTTSGINPTTTALSTTNASTASRDTEVTSDTDTGMPPSFSIPSHVEFASVSTNTAILAVDAYIDAVFHTIGLGNSTHSENHPFREKALEIRKLALLAAKDPHNPYYSLHSEYMNSGKESLPENLPLHIFPYLPTCSLQPSSSWTAKSIAHRFPLTCGLDTESVPKAPILDIMSFIPHWRYEQYMKTGNIDASVVSSEVIDTIIPQLYTATGCYTQKMTCNDNINNLKHDDNCNKPSLDDNNDKIPSNTSCYSSSNTAHANICLPLVHQWYNATQSHTCNSTFTSPQAHANSTSPSTHPPLLGVSSTTPLPAHPLTKPPHGTSATSTAPVPPVPLPGMSSSAKSPCLLQLRLGDKVFLFHLASLQRTLPPCHGHAHVSTTATNADTDACTPANIAPSMPSAAENTSVNINSTSASATEALAINLHTTCPYAYLDYVLSRILCHPSILKTGVGVKGDQTQLYGSWPEFPSFRNIESVLDLASLCRATNALENKALFDGVVNMWRKEEEEMKRHAESGMDTMNNSENSKIPEANSQMTLFERACLFEESKMAVLSDIFSGNGNKNGKGDRKSLKNKKHLSAGTSLGTSQDASGSDIGTMDDDVKSKSEGTDVGGNDDDTINVTLQSQRDDSGTASSIAAPTDTSVSAAPLAQSQAGKTSRKSTNGKKSAKTPILDTNSSVEPVSLDIFGIDRVDVAANAMIATNIDRDVITTADARNASGGAHTSLDADAEAGAQVLQRRMSNSTPMSSPLDTAHLASPSRSPLSALSSQCPPTTSPTSTSCLQVSSSLLSISPCSLMLYPHMPTQAFANPLSIPTTLSPDTRTKISTAALGLAKMCSNLLEVDVNKDMQVSQWSEWPLTAAQAHYAATDAYIVTDIIDAVALYAWDDALEEALHDV